MITVFLLHTVYIMKQANLCVGMYKTTKLSKKSVIGGLTFIV